MIGSGQNAVDPIARAVTDCSETARDYLVYHFNAAPAQRALIRETSLQSFLAVPDTPESEFDASYDQHSIHQSVMDRFTRCVLEAGFDWRKTDQFLKGRFER